MSLSCVLPPLLEQGGGSGGGWHPSVDVNAIGKSKECPLVLIEKSDGLCLGNVEEHRFVGPQSVKSGSTREEKPINLTWDVMPGGLSPQSSRG